MYQVRLLRLVLVPLTAAALASATSTAAAQVPPTPANVDVSQRHLNESEEAIAVNPTNPNNIVIVTNIDGPSAGMFEGVSSTAAGPGQGN